MLKKTLTLTLTEFRRFQAIRDELKQIYPKISLHATRGGAPDGFFNVTVDDVNQGYLDGFIEEAMKMLNLE